MKHLFIISCLTFHFFTAHAQLLEKSINTIDIEGTSKMLANPPTYIANFLIQEEEKKVGYTTIGKISIDSIKINFSTTLKKFGLEEKDLKTLGTTSKDIGQFPSYLTSIAYELKLRDKEIANKLINEMRFTGLKGIVIRRVFTQSQKTNLLDSLNNAAINEAKRRANEFAKKENKIIGEIKSIEFKFNSIDSFGMDTESSNNNFNTYEYNKFEMDNRDKYARSIVRIVFELK